MSESIGTPHTPGPPVANQPTIFHGNKAEEMLAERDKPAAPGTAVDLSPILDMLGVILDDLGKIKKRFGMAII